MKDEFKAPKVLKKRKSSEIQKEGLKVLESLKPTDSKPEVKDELKIPKQISTQKIQKKDKEECLNDDFLRNLEVIEAYDSALAERLRATMKKSLLESQLSESVSKDIHENQGRDKRIGKVWPIFLDNE